MLYDRNLHELAMTVLVDSIYADPAEMDDKQAAAHTLAAIVHVDPEDNADHAKPQLPTGWRTATTLPGLRAA